MTRPIQLIGYGNPGRGDDGLGPAFAAWAEDAAFPGLAVKTDYQLTVDHALLIAEADRVVFVDAMMNADAPYSFGPVAPAADANLGSHSLSPAAVLALTRTLYGAAPEGFVLGVAGHEFGDVKEGLSRIAEANLRAAQDFFQAWLTETPISAPTGGLALAHA
ncbi:MAG: hydrogenase maturation protease [Alphaproteobacteria bacterium]|nr:hydrogenase maturation protease [Alphaproteobacteria bacterium]